jgi:hypothetical protein
MKATERITKFRQTEKLREKKRPPVKIPPLKLTSSESGSVETAEQQNRRKQDNKALALAIKEAVEAKRSMHIQPETVYNRHPKHPPLPVVSLQKKNVSSRPGLLAGEKCNETQARLSDSSAFIGVQKYGKLPSKLFNGQGDMSRHPNGQIKQMLATTNGCQLNIPARSADFRYEVSLHING